MNTQMTGTLASPDRRFHAFVVDRVIVWGLFALAGAAAWWWCFRDDRVALGIAVIATVVLVVSGCFAVLLGLRGTSPGRSLLGLRVVDHATGQPIGVPRAMLRSAIVGVSTLPMFGLGLAALAASAIGDPSRQRRGWHDRVAGSIVIDVRRLAAAAADPAAQPRELVNLTAMRLAQVADPLAPVAPVPTPSSTSRPVPPATSSTASPPAAVPATATAGPATVGRTAPTAWRVTFDTGQSLRVEGLLLIGRHPEGRPGETVWHAVPLASADMSLSKTHAQVHLASDGALVVADRGSTNGSILIRHGVSRELTAGRPATLLPGDRVLFGDREMRIDAETEHA